MNRASFLAYVCILVGNERKVLQAGASVQSQLGCPVIIHPGRDHAAPAEILRVFGEAGGNISKTVMSHLDRKNTTFSIVLSDVVFM